MSVYKTTIKLTSKGVEPTFINITDEVKQAIADSGIQTGVCTVISPHTTCAVFLKNMYMIQMKKVLNFCNWI